MLEVEVYRDNGFANVKIDTSERNRDETISLVVMAIEELVNGKFKARFRDKTASSQNQSKLFFYNFNIFFN